MGNSLEEDIRWKQRFQNYKKALSTMKKAVETHSVSPAFLV
jgi:hypothetical protein